MLNMAESGACAAVLEARARGGGGGGGDASWGAGVPYGEILGYRNRADGDRWDVLAPGLEGGAVPTGVETRVVRVLGVVLIKGGNHKLAVELEGAPPDATRVAADVKGFIAAYAREHPNTSRTRIRFLEYDAALGYDGRQINVG